MAIDSLHIMSIQAPWAGLVVQGFQDVYNCPDTTNIKLPMWVAILEPRNLISRSATKKAKTLLYQDHRMDLPLDRQYVRKKKHRGSGCIIGFCELYRVYDDMPSLWYDGNVMSPFYDEEKTVYAWYFNKTRSLPPDRWIPLDQSLSSPLTPISSILDVDLRNRVVAAFVPD